MENDEDLVSTLAHNVMTSPWTSFGLLALCIGCVVFVWRLPDADTYINKTTPAILQETNAEARNTWAKYCLQENNRPLLEHRTPEDCINAAFKLYPEKDWVGIAKNNEVIYQQYKP